LVDLFELHGLANFKFKRHKLIYSTNDNMAPSVPIFKILTTAK